MIQNIRLHVRAKPQPLDCMIVTLIVMTQQSRCDSYLRFLSGKDFCRVYSLQVRQEIWGREEQKPSESTGGCMNAHDDHPQQPHPWIGRRSVGGWRRDGAHSTLGQSDTQQWPRELVMFSWLQVPQQKQKWKSDWFLLEICGECRVNEISQDDQEGRACSEDERLRGQTFASATGANESLEVHWWHLSKWVLCRHSSHRQTCSFPPKEQQRKVIGQQWIRIGCQGKLYPLAVSFQICKGWWQWRKGGALFNRGSSVSKLSSWPETSTEDIE